MSLSTQHQIHTEEQVKKLRARAVIGMVAGIPVSVCEAEIVMMRKQWLSMPPTTVLQSVDELPKGCVVSRNADGVWYDRRVYVIAGNINDIKQLQKVIVHECVLHHSLEDMLGDYGFSKLHHGLQKLKKSGDPVIIRLAAEVHERYGVLTPEMETQEIVARAGEQYLDETGNLKIKFGPIKKTFADVVGWLRDHGIRVRFSNAELQGIMHGAGVWVQQKH
jgi:hypothetical protein